MGTVEPPETVDAPLAELLAGVLAGVRREVAGVAGTAVSVAHPDPQRGAGRLQVLAATGVGHVLPPITTGHLWGPSLLAAGGEEPIVAADLWSDRRWPHLTLEAVRAALPGIWDDDGVVVLSVYLDRPADHRTLATLARYEWLVASAITIADVATRSAEQTDQVLNALASRAAIEQAKGAIMALRRCAADEAWAVLRRASQQFNIKLRELAVALVEHIGQSAARHSEGAECHVVSDRAARRAAELIWQALTSAAATSEPSSVGYTAPADGEAH